jgi:hypothetical protein
VFREHKPAAVSRKGGVKMGLFAFFEKLDLAKTFEVYYRVISTVIITIITGEDNAVMQFLKAWYEKVFR